MERIVQFFDYYTDKLGWDVVLLLPKSKMPFQKGWNKGYDKKATRDYLIKNPDCNLGLKLGHIIDVEGDTYKANELLNKLTADITHPMYKSQKSTHHLFTTPDNKLTRIDIHGMEFRGHYHQSMLPPSVNSEEIEYEWLEDVRFPIPSLPNSLVNLYNRHMKMMCAKKTGKYTEPWCYLCGQKSRPIHKTRFKLELTSFKRFW
jgi:hypothetical protein